MREEARQRAGERGNLNVAQSPAGSKGPRKAKASFREAAISLQRQGPWFLTGHSERLVGALSFAFGGCLFLIMDLFDGEISSTGDEGSDMSKAPRPRPALAVMRKGDRHHRR